MKKQKFDLTADLIDTNHDHEEDKAETKTKKTKPPKLKIKTVFLTMSIEENLRTEFKVWCAKHRLKMNEAFTEGFTLLKKKHGV